LCQIPPRPVRGRTRIWCEDDYPGGTEGTWVQGNGAGELARRGVEGFGRIDTWVNNTGVMVYGRFEEEAGSRVPEALGSYILRAIFPRGHTNVVSEGHVVG
jgi:hypothetical protein